MSAVSAIMHRPVREIAGLGAGVLACLTVLAFGFYLLHVEMSQNVATWGTLAALDAVIFYSSLRASSESAWLPGGYTLGASLVTLVSLLNATWHWGAVETITTIGVVTILIFRMKMSPRNAIIAGVIIMTIGIIPLLYDNWEHPFRESWWLWFACAICNATALFSTKRWSIENSLFSGVGTLLNVLMFVVVVR